MYRPFELKKDCSLEIINEAFIYIISILLIGVTDFSVGSRNKIGWLIVFCTIFLVIFNMAVVIVTMLIELFRFI